MDRFLIKASAIAAVLLLVIVGVAAASSPSPAPAQATSAQAPDLPPSGPEGPSPDPDPIPAPDFAIATRSGETFRLSEHRGEVVVLNLWATWCPPCRHEIPDFIELQDELGDEGLTVVGVALDEGGWDAVGPFADEMAINYAVAVDDGTVEGLYGPTVSLPTTFVIDREGNVAHYIPGMILRDQLEPLVRPLLDGSGS
ncbi:TlpA disulfide reductase family protein [Rubrivirga sp. IMCC43871]|uniref:TlpA disulfide reductase family protein n=1 Tax=Rubrivirga sp. IMCC43871 TaxID=3391575 RepID=UPI00398FABB9